MKLRNKRIISLLLALVMILGMMPLQAFAAEETGSGNNELAGKTISILGASISTYTGISNNPDYNSTIGNNAVYYTEGRYGVYANDTWWMQVANDLGLRLLVNNSWSGSSLLYERSGTVGAYVDRCVQLHNNDGEEPDIIGIQMGTNDFQYYKDTLGTADIDYAALITENEDGSFTYAEPTTSLEAAAIVLHKISIRYPDAEVYYLNISQRIDGTDELIRSFNAELKQVVEHFGAHIVDIYGSAITVADFDTYIGDGRVHPNCLGMDAYTEAFKRALLANTAYAVDTHTVSLNLDGVTADYGDDKIVVSGDAFSCTLTAEDGKELSVSVTMGGEDITDTTYEKGTISIESVTADVVIAAEATVHKPQNYRWEFDGTDLACVSGGNALTKDSGTTTDGVFSKTSYTLKNEVVLMHDLPWVVEWKCEGTFLNTNGSSGARIFTSDNVNANYNARYIFKSNTNGIVAMGEKTTSGSHNYGIALADHGIDWTELHTYRLENRIADDGSNMIYLLVDGEEIGPMNHYYIGTKAQNTTSDWLSGKDFVFPYMGTDTHGFTNASIKYISVAECGHTYENGICTGCGDININWEIGTIAAANGANSPNTTRLRTTDYLAFADFSGVSVNVGYQLTWLAYDAEKNYIGNGTATFTGYWQPSGQSIATADIQNLYSNAVYFRLALKAVSGGSMTLEDVQNSGVTFIPFGEALPEPEYELEYESSLNIGSWQDGAIWNGKLFVLGGSGTGAVYDLKDLSKLAAFSLDSADVLKPHANSVCFGSTYYAPGDKYPLLYVNVYNNYASAADRMEGTCCVYRITETDSGFVTELVQVIEIGFTEDLTLWKSKENNGDVRPYGNFLVDTEENKLYAYVMRDATKATRFFKFDLPELTDGIYSETYGCNVVTMERADIEGQFDTEYFNYLQGGTYSSGMILSAEGFNSGSSAEPAIRIIDLQTGTVSATYYMTNSGLTAEPEVICVDPATGLLYYAPADGTLRILTIPDVHFHTYENGTCTGCDATQPGPVITQQPTNGEAKLGERYCVTVEAEGVGLKYQWYIRNAGSKRFSKSSVKDNTYDDVMTAARAGREVYCVITDANGNSVKTDTVKLVLLPSEELAIVTQPTDGEAALGERYCVTVEAKGEGLKYQWYFRNKGATHWTKSSVTDNTYDDVMNNTRNGREVKCVITDRFGNSVTTDIVKLVRVPMKLEITSQPVDAEAAFGETFCATVAAKGEGLKYQWYYRNSSKDSWHKSGVRDNTYDDVMTKARAGREVYCVITDKYGNSVTTDVVKLIAVPTVELKLLGVTYEAAALGERYCVTVNAEGEGLKYQWYFRNAGATRWSKSGVTDNTYDDVMNKTRANREVYCVITDACGNQVITEVITLTVEK